MRIFVPIVALTVHRTAGPESLQGEGFALSIRRRHLVFAAFSGSTAGSEKKPEIRDELLEARGQFAPASDEGLILQFAAHAVVC
jgi:hypothetical protein